jgi:hypothetical protein
MTHGRGTSDSAVVAGKSVNKVEQLAVESMERRAKEMWASKPRAGHRTGKACHLRWNAYDKQQSKGRRNGSPRSSTTSTSTCFGSRSLN